MFKKKKFCSECGKQNMAVTNEEEGQEIIITAIDFKDGWMKDSDIKLPEKISKLLAVRICNRLLKAVNVNCILSELLMHNIKE